MEIIFKGPTFFCQADEEHFFNWIYSLPAFGDIAGHGFELQLTLKEEVDKDTLEQLIVIFKRWEIDLDSLSPLRSFTQKSALPWVKEALK